jgi:Fic-DOC domain mobile mystery protein B
MIPGTDGNNSPLAGADGRSRRIEDVIGKRAEHLIAGHLVDIDEVLTLEQARLLETRRWVLGRRRSSIEILTVAFLMQLHKRLYDGIWDWAGQLRRTDAADGARWPTIGIELNDLIGRAKFWQERKLYGSDELALRFHHGLYRIHAWEGGNGVHARLAADALVALLGRTPFRWGQGRYDSAVAARERYLVALREADAGSFEALRNFARAA